MVRVFITVDTEMNPFSRDWRENGLRAEYRRDILCETPRGAWGVPYQLSRLNAHGIKAVFFVEALFACAAGPTLLEQIVAMVQGAGHEVQLHVHAEWLHHMAEPFLAPRSGEHIRMYPLAEQAEIIKRALANLRAAGARGVCAYRAGNYGADFDTLRALAQNGIRFDTSYNEMYLDTACALRHGAPMLQPGALEGVTELPISFFRQRGGVRHAQLQAISSAEMRRALLHAWRGGWRSFVIVSHSFELINGRRRGADVRHDPLVVRRFEKLCAFLAAHRDKFVTSGFSDLDPAEITGPFSGPPLDMPLPLTAARMAEQLFRQLALQ